MEEDRDQKELFEFEKPRKGFPGLGSILPKRDFERNVAVTLTLEKVIFISIGIVMLMVVIYALGVEAGRSRMAEQIASQSAVKKEVGPQAPASNASMTPRQIAPVSVQVNKAPASVQSYSKSYTIVTGSFTKRENAAGEVAQLRRRGFNAYIGQTYPLYQVYVGAFANKTGADALAELKRIKNVRKDAYLK
ncbi:MAG: SPOR domain-containing protein [Candidatus Omnitrophota bacterium]|jgi:cell division protein FtsN